MHLDISVDFFSWHNSIKVNGPDGKQASLQETEEHAVTAPHSGSVQIPYTGTNDPEAKEP